MMSDGAPCRFEWIAGYSKDMPIELFPDAAILRGLEPE